ncbi:MULTISPECIES: ABC transporter ATP-binding protein [unclassified Treponema]|uniref:ABC transporter ATP-binding protein n=1 Tax=unclassified Treponema TaxID=2638727 RepID=UPI0020A48405|nr:MULTISPECIES: ABC transporter ATP-binding protein [unclassified Treponema]UTC67169.1 ABC transporter ATP-binding protein [Treponema sp. OMZ 789]UTC69899.1 ABC transporter ATP-binding protein [Treponema sp. OMZ 790]UTC72614.1 ABC transporter ATP-binding protein [Treponema sp. OMZ 791]
MISDEVLKVEKLKFSIGRGKKAFSLDGISFSIPRGCVTGLIGENGAGKTTLIRLLLDMYQPESGKIFIFGEKLKRENIEIKEKIGFVINDSFLSLLFTPKKFGRFFAGVYKNWNQELYEKYLNDFKIPPSRFLSGLSSGTMQKLQIAIALSHGAELLILDEPLNFLDPVSKKEFLDLIRNFMLDENHSVLISSHQTNELEKICDEIVFISEGKKVFDSSLENINKNYGLLKIDEKTFKSLYSNEYIGYRKTDYAYEVLVSDKENQKFNGMVCEDASLEDIMYFYTKEKI